MKIVVGIYGGSFNPIHYGHYQVAKAVIDSGSVDQVVFMPCYKHNLNKKIIDIEHRLEMCKQSINGNSQMYVSDYEVLLRSKGKTYEIIKKLKKLYGDDHYEFKLIIGSDCIHNIKTWYKWNKLLRIIPFVIVNRISEPSIDDNIKNLLDKYKPNYCDHKIIMTKVVPISSTEIRKCCYNKDVTGYIHPNTLTYIRNNNLYKE